MSNTSPVQAPNKSKKGLRRPFWTALVVIFLWFGANGVLGPLFGKLTSVQTNDNSAFLPLTFLAELAFAVGFGVLLDTIVVRSILVPSLVRDIGGKIWWPSKLQDKQ